MRIKRVVIRNLKALQERDDRFDLPLDQGPSPAVCLRGVNGSGKTTYLEAIASLWRLFRSFSKPPTSLARPSLDLALFELYSRGQVGILLSDLPGPISTLWLIYGPLEHGRVGYQGTVVAGHPVHSPSGSKRTRINYHPDPELNVPWKDLSSYWEKRFDSLRLAALSESRPEPIPNMVYLGAENRYVEPLAAREDLSEPAMEESFRWLARYSPSHDKRHHIENSITALRLVSPSRFKEIRDRIHSVLSGVELLDQSDSQTMRPLIRVRNGALTTLDGLSAGERAAFIALFFIARWMSPGGIVLIDEPELHQHLSLMRINLAVLEEYVVRKMGGQLIVASHATEVWEHFRHTKLLIDLDYPVGSIAGGA